MLFSWKCSYEHIEYSFDNCAENVFRKSQEKIAQCQQVEFF